MIEILNQQNRYPINVKTFKDLLDMMISFYSLQNPEITLAFVNNAAIRKLNLRFLQKDAPTDVLSFPLGDKGPDGKYYLGDIIISVPQAAKQSAPKKHLLERELKILTIHGFLHLLGFEHFKGIEEEEEKIKDILFKNKNGN